MKKEKFTEEKIIGAVKNAPAPPNSQGKGIGSKQAVPFSSAEVETFTPP
jgi:hypothetical protein